MIYNRKVCFEYGSLSFFMTDKLSISKYKMTAQSCLWNLSLEPAFNRITELSLKA